jgi:hypothetical protein
MKVLSRLSESEKLELTKGVIQVSGRAMNRTALGVVDAILTLYPSLTFAELKELLPDTINPSASNRYKSLFSPYNPNRLYGVVQPGSIRKECADNQLDLEASHFCQEGETFFTADGVEVLVSKTWETADTVTKENDLQNLIDHVAQHGVKVVEHEKSKPFNKGGYSLEVINPALFSKIKSHSQSTQNKKVTSYTWLYFAFAIILLLIGLYLYMS